MGRGEFGRLSILTQHGARAGVRSQKKIEGPIGREKRGVTGGMEQVNRGGVLDQTLRLKDSVPTA